MNKKKLSLATTALALSAVMLAGCGNNAENKAVTETTDISVTEEVTEATTTTAATTTEVTTTTTAATTTEVTTTTTEITTAATTTTEATTTEAITTTEAVTEAITEKVTEKVTEEKPAETEKSIAPWEFNPANLKPVKDYSDVEWGDDIPTDATNVYGKKIKDAEWMQEAGGNFIYINGRYYRTFQDWVDGKTPLNAEEVTGKTYEEVLEEVGIIEWN